jgi:hypothetical protein
VVVHGLIVGPFAQAAQLLEDSAGAPRETIRRSDDNSRRKMQNVRGDGGLIPILVTLQ